MLSAEIINKLLMKNIMPLCRWCLRTLIIKWHTIGSRYLEVQGILWNTSRYPYLNISDLPKWGKNNSNNHI